MCNAFKCSSLHVSASSEYTRIEVKSTNKFHRCKVLKRCKLLVYCLIAGLFILRDHRVIGKVSSAISTDCFSIWPSQIQQLYITYIDSVCLTVFAIGMLNTKQQHQQKRTYVRCPFDPTKCKMLYRTPKCTLFSICVIFG